MFGVVDYLLNKDYSQGIVKSETHDDLFASIVIPDFIDLVAVDFSITKYENWNEYGGF